MRNCMRIWDENFADGDIVANKYISSADANYPEANLYDKYRRLKTWRSAGYWNIESGSNTIVFRETTGVDLTATITAGEYTTTASFLAAIKSALEASGASTYTVSQTSVRKINIESDGSGGGGIFQLRWPSSTAMADILGYDSTVNYTGALNYDADVIRIHTSEWIKWDFGIPSTPTAFALIHDRNKPLKISPNAVIKLQGNTTDNWASPQVEITIPYQNYILAYENTDGFFTSPLRYWRAYFEDKDNAYGYLEFGFVYLGDAYSPDRGCPQFPFDFQLNDPSPVTYSEGGQSFSQKRPKTQTLNIQWGALYKGELEYLEGVFNRFGRTDPFFISFDSGGAYSTEPTSWIRYCKFNEEPSARLVSPNNFQMSWQMREEL